MIDQKLAANISCHGSFQDSIEKRSNVLRDLGFRVGQKAEYAFIAGCVYPELIPHVFRALKEFFDYYRVDCTLLSKEYCCGYPLIQPAAAAKNDDEVARAKELSREFIYENFKQAKELGAKSIVLFCTGCEPNYADLQKETDLEVLSYYELLDRYFTGGVLEIAIDYYAGCYRFRRKITREPVDVEAAQRVLDRIKGLKVNYVDNKLCCFIEPLVEKLISSLVNKTLITICSGCHATLTGKLKDRDGYQVKMLPEIVMESLKKK